MELMNEEVVSVPSIDALLDSQIAELSESQLALVGGGVGEVIVG